MSETNFTEQVTTCEFCGGSAQMGLRSLAGNHRTPQECIYSLRAQLGEAQAQIDGAENAIRHCAALKDWGPGSAEHHASRVTLLCNNHDSNVHTIGLLVDQRDTLRSENERLRDALAELRADEEAGVSMLARIDEQLLHTGLSFRGKPTGPHTIEHLGPDDRARLVVEALDATREALRLIQWDECERCPQCYQSKVRGHAPDCEVGAALAGETKRVTPEECIAIATKIHDETWEVFKGRVIAREPFERGADYTQGYADGASEVADKINAAITAKAQSETGGAA